MTNSEIIAKIDKIRDLVSILKELDINHLYTHNLDKFSFDEKKAKFIGKNFEDYLLKNLEQMLEEICLDLKLDLYRLKDIDRVIFKDKNITHTFEIRNKKELWLSIISDWLDIFYYDPEGFIEQYKYSC